MLQVIPKWKVTIKFSDRVVEFWMYDNHASNVASRAAAIQFTENGLDEPVEIIVARAA